MLNFSQKLWMEERFQVNGVKINAILKCFQQLFSKKEQLARAFGLKMWKIEHNTLKQTRQKLEFCIKKLSCTFMNTFMSNSIS